MSTVSKDDSITSSPLRHESAAVERDERDRAADAVGDRLGVCVGDVGDDDAVVVVANARDRRRVGAERRAREQQPALRRRERRAKAVAPREVLAEVVRLVDDHERVAADLRRPRRRIARHARVGDGDAVEVPWGLGALRVRLRAARRAPLPRQPTGV